MLSSESLAKHSLPLIQCIRFALIQPQMEKEKRMSLVEPLTALCDAIENHGTEKNKVEWTSPEENKLLETLEKKCLQ